MYHLDTIYMAIFDKSRVFSSDTPPVVSPTGAAPSGGRMFTAIPPIMSSSLGTCSLPDSHITDYHTHSKSFPRTHITASKELGRLKAHKMEGNKDNAARSERQTLHKSKRVAHPNHHRLVPLLNSIRTQGLGPRDKRWNQ